LQADHVGLRLRGPIEEMRKPDLEGVDVPGREFHLAGANVMSAALAEAAALRRARTARSVAARPALPPRALPAMRLAWGQVPQPPWARVSCGTERSGSRDIPRHPATAGMRLLRNRLAAGCRRAWSAARRR